MRISDHRYSRERARMELALRFLRHEARTQTIRIWTGLSDDRIRKLYRSYMSQARRHLPRHRGKSPHQVAYFTRSLRLQEETAVLPSVLSLPGALPLAVRRSGRGRLVCAAAASTLSALSALALAQGELAGRAWCRGPGRRAHPVVAARRCGDRAQRIGSDQSAKAPPMIRHPPAWCAGATAAPRFGPAPTMMMDMIARYPGAR